MSKKLNTNTRLAVARLVFWDFDGVIKESVDIKTRAFGCLFESFGSEIVRRVQVHHIANGGISRFDKILLYLGWAGIQPTEEFVSNYCDRFGELVLQSVIESPWVPGAQEYLRVNPHRQNFVLVSATPRAELELILDATDLASCFTAVFGAPTSKSAAMHAILSRRQLRPDECLMVGDSQADFDAASENHVPFLLRRHSHNQLVFRHYTSESVTDFKAL